MIGRPETPFSPWRVRLAGAVALSVGLCLAAPANAQMVCGNHADIEKRLWNGYQEVVVGRGLGANGALIEIYASEKGTFTVVLTRPNGMSCLMAVGENYERIKNPKTAGLDT